MGPRVLLLGLLALVLACSRDVFAHGMRTAYVELTELAPGRALVRVASPASMAAPSVTPAFEAGCTLERQASLGSDRSFALGCDRPIAGLTMRIEGLGPVVSDAVVWISLEDGASFSHLVSFDHPSWTIPSASAPLATIRRYVSLGVRHIFTGVDHLLFLLALGLALRRPRSVIVAETAFTLSHTLSFSASALGWIVVSPAAAEACIALSLVLVAVECARAPEPRMSPRRGAALALTFGLVHGLGFAGGLAEIGLPPRGIASALAGFALGVEAGQVAFLAVVLGLLAVLARLRAQRGFAWLGSYAVGAAGSFLLLCRLADILDQRFP
jgi:hydrogenase/urease accessory protein HupE